jgi:hypothetical protein
MHSAGSFLYGFMLPRRFYIRSLRAQLPTKASNVPTIRVSSRLVLLEVTVLDRKGHIVVAGLTKDDLVVTEEKKRQRIFSCETRGST